MSNLLIKLKSYITFKNNKLVKLYLLLFYISNAVYLYLEIINNKLSNLWGLHPHQQKFYFEKMVHNTNQTSSIVQLLIIVNVLYLVLNLIKYKIQDHKGVNEYLIISLISLLSIFIFSMILHAIFAAYYLLEPTYLVAAITLIVLIITLIKRAYALLLSRSKG